MLTIYKSLTIIAGAFLFSASSAFSADDMPTKQPAVISIIREQVKVGHDAAHGRNEQGWPAALEKAKHPYHYLALTSITGPSEAWYIIPYESHAQMGDDFKRADDNPVLSAELDRLAAEDAEHVSASTTVHAMARPELSYGDFPDIVQMRLFEITLFTIRPGYSREFEESAKAYIAAEKRSEAKAGFRAYEVLAGMPSPTYLFFSSYKEFGDLDKGMEEFGKAMNAATAEEKSAMNKGMREAVLKEETTRFRVDPKQSYISQETRKKAPDFWLPK